MAYLHALTRTAATADYWAAQSKFADTIETEQSSANLGCGRVAMTFTRASPAGTREDVCVMTLTLAKIVGGGLYGALVTADYAAAETALDALWTSLKARVSNQYTLSEYIWHEHRANHLASEKGYEVIGPAVRRTAKAVVGSVNLGRNTDQVSATVTFRNTSRKHWGRVYLPGISINDLDAQTGRLMTTSVDSVATAFRTFEASCNAASLQLGTWTYKFKAFLPLSEIRMDNVLDIQRRRRPKQANYNKSFTS